MCASAGARVFEVGGSYTLASGKATKEIESVFVQQDDRYPDDAYGYTSNDERHRVAVNGSFVLPWGVQVAPSCTRGAAGPSMSRPAATTTGTAAISTGRTWPPA